MKESGPAKVLRHRGNRRKANKDENEKSPKWRKERQKKSKRRLAMPEERKGETMLIGSFAIRTRVEPKKQASLKPVQAKSNDNTEKERTVKGIAVRKSDEGS